MVKGTIECSVIIVNYKVKHLLLKCIDSVLKNTAKLSIEIIVVDNEQSKAVRQELKNRFPNVTYISNRNKGFGQANNVGARVATGKYLFFLNPDTEIAKNTIKNLLNGFKNHKKLGIIAPTLLDINNKPYKLQGTTKLGVKEGIVALSFLNKIFPNNPISKKYWLLGKRRNIDISVDVVPGTAFILQRSLYEEIGGFDEKFFLYFEEYDLCKRVRELGYKIVITPNAKVKHLWGESTKRAKINTRKIYFASQYYYFKKHFGVLNAILVSVMTKIDYKIILLFLVILAAFILRAFELQKGMILIGDQGWYFLSARDMILSGEIPLVGIPSSHLWINQGAYWTYLLSIVFTIFNFNPISAGYFSVVIDCLTIVAIYLFSSRFLNTTVGIVSALLYTTSPLLTMLSRMPYHTSPIPLFTIVYLYCVARWMKGDHRFFPIVLTALAVLYNFELSTFVLGLPVVLIFIYGYIKKKSFVLNLLNIKYFILSLFALAIPLAPFIIYDLNNNYSQTFMFIVFLFYKIVVKFGYPSISLQEPANYIELLAFLCIRINELIITKIPYLGVLLFIASLFFLFAKFVKNRKLPNVEILLLISFSSSLLGFIVAGVKSDAYLPIFFPIVILIIAVGLVKNFTRLYLIVILSLLVAINSFTIVQQAKESMYFTKVLSASKIIIDQSKGEEYKIIGRGEGSYFTSYTDTYEYLTWWLGHGPSESKEVKKYFVIEELDKTVIINSTNK